MDNTEKSATVGTYDTGRRQTKQKTKQRKLKIWATAKCWTSICANINTIHNKTWALLQTTGGKGEPNISLCGNRNGQDNTELRM